MTGIGSNAFQGCTSLASINIPKGVKGIDPYAFEGCTSLASINISEGLEWIGDYAFSGCSSLESLNIPEGVTYIGWCAFLNCISLASINIPEGLEQILDDAFTGCHSLSSITIPSSVRTFQNFHDCPNLSDIKVEGDNPYFDSRDNCNAIISTLENRLVQGCKTTTIPNGVTTIWRNAFNGSNISSIIIPNSVTAIDSTAFLNCHNLAEIKVDGGNRFFDSRDNCNAIIKTSENCLILGGMNTVIPPSVTSIGSNAYYGRSGITSLVIPSQLVSIGYYAFSGCKLENIIINNYNTRIRNSFSYSTFQHAILYVPAGHRWDAIYGNGGWSQFNNIREIAMESRDLSETRAYTLMNTNDFSLAVYDAVNGEVTNVSSLYDIDENNAKNAWQIIKGDDDNYLYNIVARQYAGIDADGKFFLSYSPVAISLQDTENGFSLGGNDGQQWGFVINEKVKPNKDLTAVDHITLTAIRDAYYTLDGQRLSQVKKGLNIVRTGDGKAKKVVLK